MEANLTWIRQGALKAVTVFQGLLQRSHTLHGKHKAFLNCSFSPCQGSYFIDKVMS